MQEYFRIKLFSKDHLDLKVQTVMHMLKFMHTGGLKDMGLMYVKSNRGKCL